jgi:hypothetical protein
MSSNNNNNNKQQRHHKNYSRSCEKIYGDMNKGFHMDIKDEFTDPFDDMYDFNHFEQRMFNNFKNVFNRFNLLPEEEKNPINPNEHHEHNGKQNAFNNGTVFSQVYCSSYNNINGKPHKECYKSQSIKQMNNGHNISEAREAYKNSDGIMKSAYQRALDKKGARLIQEKNAKTGQHNQHRILKGIKENEIENFNKEYNDYYQKCGFKNNYKALNSMNPFVKTNNKQITDGKCNNNRN